MFSHLIDEFYNKICYSMENNPNEWIIEKETNKVVNKFTGTLFWVQNGEITTYCNSWGSDNHIINDYNKNKLKNAFEKLKAFKAVNP